jgi:type II secretory pathway component GspD/PulD (secretin)
MMKYLNKISAVSWMGLIAFVLVGQTNVMAQEQESGDASGAQIIEPGEGANASEFVTINVKDANIAEVLKAYSLQTGQSIVVGPDVVSDNVNVRLNNIPWEEALDVILKPYGFGYRVVGDTIVISKLENIVTVEGIEPLASKVFTLKFLDAYDIRAICTAQLSTRGKFTILETRGLPGWEFGGEGTGGAATEAGIRRRRQKEDIQKSKTFVITDVPSAITKIENIIEEMDMLPEQVLIESKFLEINTDNGSQIGLDYISGVERVNPLGATSGSLQPSTLADLNKILNLTTGYPDPLQTAAAGSLSQESGLRLSHATIGGQGYDLLFNLIAQDDSANVLSAPKILTINNQEAAMLVGQKYPIIESQNTSSGSGGAGNTATRLDYYENVGIQLNVIPQVCADDYINMIVHPAVSEIEGFETGVVFSGGDQASGTPYPILRIREAETQIMIKSGNAAVIGGLQTERDTEAIEKIPLLGDIPFIGRLFRNETIRREKIDLLIFLKASLVDDASYSEASQRKEEAMQAKMELELVQEAAEAEEAAVEVEAAEIEAATEEAEISEAENAEILALVQQMDAPADSTNEVDVVEVVEVVEPVEMVEPVEPVTP